MVSADTEAQPICGKVVYDALTTACGDQLRPFAEESPHLLHTVTIELRIEVIDHGPGIPDDDVARIFERYQRGGHTRSTEHGGTGLGLAIAQWVVELHDGSITATPADPRGCRMVLDLPDEPRIGDPA